MVSHKTPRGAAALGRLKLFEGIPPPYDKQKRMVVPAALRVIRLRPGRRYTNLGKISTEVGWKYDGVVKRLEEKRKLKSNEYYERKKSIQNLRQRAIQNKSKEPEFKRIQNELNSLGF